MRTHQFCLVALLVVIPGIASVAASLSAQAQGVRINEGCPPIDQMPAGITADELVRLCYGDDGALTCGQIPRPYQDPSRGRTNGGCPVQPCLFRQAVELCASASAPSRAEWSIRVFARIYQTESKCQSGDVPDALRDGRRGAAGGGQERPDLIPQRRSPVDRCRDGQQLDPGRPRRCDSEAVDRNGGHGADHQCDPRQRALRQRFFQAGTASIDAVTRRCAGPAGFRTATAASRC